MRTCRWSRRNNRQQEHQCYPTGLALGSQSSCSASRQCCCGSPRALWCLALSGKMGTAAGLVCRWWPARICALVPRRTDRGTACLQPRLVVRSRCAPSRSSLERQGVVASRSCARRHTSGHRGATRDQRVYLAPLSAHPPFVNVAPLAPSQYYILLLRLPFFAANIVGEELWWRGFIQPGQEAVFGSATWIVQGLLHGAFHFSFGLGLIFVLLPAFFAIPWAVQRTRNTSVGMVIHGGINGSSSRSLELKLSQ